MSSSKSEKKSVLISFGSNLGDRSNNILSALKELGKIATINTTSFLYESAPMYYLDQNTFLNGACLIETLLSPQDLLLQLKSIESNLGREKTIDNGPRKIDLDIIFYEDMVHESSNLQIPHRRMQERAFVLKPLCDIDPNWLHPTYNQSISTLYASLPKEQRQQVQRVIPIRKNPNDCPTLRDRMLYLDNISKPLIFGILNVTPDSFSDGGSHNASVEQAVLRAQEILREGARIIDIGGESTRPNAELISIEEELQRVIPVIRRLREVDKDCLISIDTRKAHVAQEAVRAGANIINDVSAGRFDPAMLAMACSLGVPFIFMHMRGDPQSMMSQQQYSEDIVMDVAQELQEQLHLVNNIMPRWLQIVDPGIGFAKGWKENTLLLKPSNLLRLKTLLNNRPLLVGLSRKRFLTRLLEEQKVEAKNDNALNITLQERDLATAGACCAAILGGAEMIRVHNVHDVSTVCNTFQNLLNLEG